MGFATRTAALDPMSYLQLRMLMGSYRADERYGKILKSIRSLALSLGRLESILRRSRISICLLQNYLPDFSGLTYFWHGDNYPD